MLLHTQIEANCEFTNNKRTSVALLPNDPEAASFLKVLTFMVSLYYQKHIFLRKNLILLVMHICFFKFFHIIMKFTYSF